MSFLRTANPPVTMPVYTGLQLQTSSSAVPIAIVYGVAKVAPNIIWSGNFQSHGGGGKGGGGKGGVVGKGGGQATYSSAVMLGICEGPINQVSAVFDNTTIDGLGNVGSLPSPSFFNGATPQSPWSFLSGDQALGYNGTAIIADSDASLGSSATLDSYAFEVAGVCSSSGFNSYDADPALIIQDFLTNPQYGVGFPSASIDATTLFGASSDASYQTYCKAAGLALSPALTNQEAANSILARWLQLTNTAAVWSSGVLKFIPYGDAAITGSLLDQGFVSFGTSSSGQTFTSVNAPQVQIGSCSFNPDLTPVYNLGDDDFIHDDENDPVLVERSDPYAAYNMQILEISQRSNYYDSTPITAFDQNAIELYGLRIASSVTANEICDPVVAQTAAQLILQRGLYIRNHYTFKLSWEYCLLEPMDLVTLSDTNLGLNNAVVRITEIEEDDNGLLTVTAEEFPAGVATAVAYPTQDKSSGTVATNATAGPVNAPIIFEPPSSLTGGTAQIWAAVSGGTGGVSNPNWGGANIWASLDDSTYMQIGRITGPSVQGVTSTALPAFAGANPDRADTLDVKLAESGGTLNSTSAAGAANAATLCLVDHELLAFETATLSGGNAYALTVLYRGIGGSAVVAHATGAPFARLDDAIFKYDLPANYIGQTIYLKIQSFNTFGGGAEDLSTCAVYSYTPVGSGTFGPVAQALAIGTNLDYSLASLVVTETDDFGLASDTFSAAIDLGLASETGSASGSTGSTTPITPSSIGAAASGANSDITSLTDLSGIGINTAVDTVTNRLSVKSASVLFDNVGNGVQLTVNKDGSADTGSMLFQTGSSGRALAGLLQSDRYRISVSSDGTTFTQAIDIDPATGHVGLAGYTADSNNGLGVLGTSFLFSAAIDSCRFTFNKAATSDDASLTFETNFSARALAGLLGSDGYQLKVSPDGSSFFQVYVADQTTGNLAFKALLGTAVYTVAALPAGFNGALAFASNGRKAGEGAGSGSGVIVAFSNGAWRRLSDESIVTA